MEQTIHLNKWEPGHAEQASAFGVDFWYVPQKGREVWMKTLLRNSVGDRDAVSEEDLQRLEDFFSAMGESTPSGQITVSVTAGSETCWLQLQYAWVNGTPVVWVMDVTQSRKIRLLGQIGLENDLNMEGIKRGLFFCAADLTENAVLFCRRRARGSVLTNIETYDQLISDLCEHYADPRDRRRLRRVLSRDYLQDMADQGRPSVEAVARAMNIGQEPGRVEIRMDMARDTYSDHLCVWMHIQFVVDAAEEQAGTDQPLHDSVTGVYSREEFVRQLELSPKRGTLAVIRIQQMAQVNDLLGSRRGDRVLWEQARTLAALLRDGELLGRYSGAEFLMYLAHGASGLLEERLRIITAMLSRELEQGLKISAQLGAVRLDEESGSFDELYEKARLALRSVQWTEETSFAFYSPELRAFRETPAEPVPRSPEESRIFIRTFGYFDVFVDGQPIHFQGGQAKELMALLVDRRGGYLSSGEAIACLWENEPATKTTLARLRKVAMRLKNSLEEAGIAEIIQAKNGERRVVPEKFSCDYYDFLAQGSRGGAVFPGSYMTNYSWAEDTLASMISETK